MIKIVHRSTSRGKQDNEVKITQKQSPTKKFSKKGKNKCQIENDIERFEKKMVESLKVKSFCSNKEANNKTFEYNILKQFPNSSLSKDIYRRKIQGNISFQ